MAKDRRDEREERREKKQIVIDVDKIMSGLCVGVSLLGVGISLFFNLSIYSF